MMTKGRGRFTASTLRRISCGPCRLQGRKGVESRGSRRIARFISARLNQSGSSSADPRAPTAAFCSAASVLPAFCRQHCGGPQVRCVDPLWDGLYTASDGNGVTRPARGGGLRDPRARAQSSISRSGCGCLAEQGPLKFWVARGGILVS